MALAVVSAPSKILAIPKSVTLSSPSPANMMLSGLTSRCRTPWPCALASAAAAAMPIEQVVSGDSAPAAIRCLSVPPESSSMTSKQVPSCST